MKNGSLFLSLALLMAPCMVFAARQGTVLMYPTALKTGTNLLADLRWNKPNRKVSPHAIATMGRGGPLNASAIAMTIENDMPEYAYWTTSTRELRAGRTYFSGAWTRIVSARILLHWSGRKGIDVRAYRSSGCDPELQPYLDDDIKRRLAGDPDEWRLIARTFRIPSDATLGVHYGFYREAGKATFAEPFLIDITDQPHTLDVLARGAKPIRKLVVIRTDTRDSEWHREFEEPVADFFETLPERIRAFDGMGANSLCGYALLVAYADGTEDRVACPAEGIFIQK